MFKIIEKVLFNIASESELRLHFEWTKVKSKLAKMINWARFWKTPKTQAFGQTVLPDMSFLKGQKLVENGKIEKNQMRHFW